MLVFGLGSLLLKYTAGFAPDNRALPTNNGNNDVGSCPETGSPPSPGPVPTKPGSLSNVPTADRGTFGANALGICAIAMKSGAYWVGFVCATAVIVGVRMASGPSYSHAPL